MEKKQNSNVKSYKPLDHGAEMYLDLLKKCLTRYIFDDGYRPIYNRIATKILTRYGLRLMKNIGFDPRLREEGRDWPPTAETMIGLHRLANIQACMTDVIRSGIPGDFIEAGVWRGGAAIFMRGILKAYNITDRKIWVADSFKGLPKPNTDRYPEDKGDIHWTLKPLIVSLAEVKTNFKRYGLFDDQVQFLPGWFKDTLSAAPMDQLAVIRMDADMYSSTMDALEALYQKLSPGGYVIIDDYNGLPQCKKAVDDFRKKYRIKDYLKRIDWIGVFWKKTE